MKLLEDLDVYAFRKGWPRWACFAVPLFYPSCWPIIVYRFGSWVAGLQPVWLKLPFYLIYFPLKRIMEVLTTIEISEYAEIGGGLFIAHLGSIVVGHHSKVGRFASMHQGVTLGGEGEGGGFPIIGDRVYFGAGSKIIGSVKIGNGVVIGANAVVTHDAPDNSVLVGIPAKVISFRGSGEFVHFRGKISLGFSPKK